MTLTLPATIASRQDVMRLRTEVERYRSWMDQYENAAKRSVTYQNEQPMLSEGASLMIRQWLDSKQLLTDMIKNLADIAASAPSMTLTLAGPPPASVQASLVTWVRENIDPAMLVEFRWNTRILGGIIAKTDTGFHDWSYRDRLLANRDKLIERLAHV